MKDACARHLRSASLPIAPAAERPDTCRPTSTLSRRGLATPSRPAVPSRGRSALRTCLLPVRRWLLEAHPRSAELAPPPSRATGSSRAVALRDKFRKEPGTAAARRRRGGVARTRDGARRPRVDLPSRRRCRGRDGRGGPCAGARAAPRRRAPRSRPRWRRPHRRPRSVDRCIDLLHQLRPLAGREPSRDDEDVADDRDLFGAAAFGVARECCTALDPTVPEVALTLGVALRGAGDGRGHTGGTGRGSQGASRRTRDQRDARADARRHRIGGGSRRDTDAARRAYRAALPSSRRRRGPVARGESASGARRACERAWAASSSAEGRIDAARALFTESVGEGKVGRRAPRRWPASSGATGRRRSPSITCADALTVTDVNSDPALRGEVAAHRRVT